MDRPSTAVTSAEFRILGPLDLVSDGGAIRPTAGKQRAVLALLLVDPGLVAAEVAASGRFGDAVARRLGVSASPADHCSAGTIEFRILGPLETVDGGRPVDLASGKRRALLALLLLDAGRVVPVDRLVDDLWGDEPPASAPKMVQILVSQLRKQLPQGLIETRSPGYRLRLDGHSLDLQEFERLHAHGREALADGRMREAATALRRALALWQGAPLAEFDEPFAQLEQARLSEQHLVCSEQCFDAELALGCHAELVAELEALVRRHPLRERPLAQLMLALYRSGRHAEALGAFRSFRRRLHDELGIDPPPRLRELERLMLRQDASLELEPVDRAAATSPDVGDFAACAPISLEPNDVVAGESSTVSATTIRGVGPGVARE